MIQHLLMGKSWSWMVDGVLIKTNKLNKTILVS